MCIEYAAWWCNKIFNGMLYLATYDAQKNYAGVCLTDTKGLCLTARAIFVMILMENFKSYNVYFF